MNTSITSLSFCKSIVGIYEEDVHLGHSLELLLRSFGCHPQWVDVSMLRGGKATSQLDLLILGIPQLNLDWVSILNVLGERHPHLPVLILAGFPIMGNEVKNWEGKSIYWLSKPFSKDEFRKKIKEIKKVTLSAHWRV